jgi:glycosyltransferase involved in cell wall biosynthesis
MFGPKVGGGGLGRYVEELVKELQSTDHKNRFVVFLKSENFNDFNITNKNFEKRLADVPWYSLKEQLSLSKIIDSENLDLVHFPHWNVPLNLKTKFVVTIHDLILLEQPLSAKATTKSRAVYLLKYLAYKIVLKNALTKSQKIITISDYTRSSIKKWFKKIDPKKIHVIHDGLTKLTGKEKAPKEKSEIKHDFLLYVGNAYPHKNLNRLIEAFSLFQKDHPKTQLILAGSDNVFYQRLLKKKPENVLFIKNPSDQELKWLYSNASLYIFPSLIEGFGLPALEAMDAGLPVVASNNTALPEILGNSALYFNPTDEKEIHRTIKKAYEDKTIQKQLIGSGKKQTLKYSWSKMAKEIKQVYENCGN